MVSVKILCYFGFVCEEVYGSHLVHCGDSVSATRGQKKNPAALVVCNTKEDYSMISSGLPRVKYVLTMTSVTFIVINIHVLRK